MMTRAMTYLADRLRRAWRREDGVASIEFVLLFPLFLGIMVSGAESGLLMTRHMLLERGLDMAVRGIRLSSGKPIASDTIKSFICDRMLNMDNCAQNLTIEMTRIYDVENKVWSFPPAKATCIDTGDDIEPVVTFNDGADSEVMLIRACLAVDLMFPEIWLGDSLTKDSGGAYHMVAASAFAIEPL